MKYKITKVTTYLSVSLLLVACGEKTVQLKDKTERNSGGSPIVQFTDDNAKQFLTACAKDYPESPKEACTRILWSERSKQAWALETYNDQHAEVISKPNDRYKMSKIPDDWDAIGHIGFWPNPIYLGKSWINLADIRTLSKKDRERVLQLLTGMTFSEWSTSSPPQGSQ